ncbi:MAG: AI-2E family transporter [Gammaproteobacteria bacterium]
MSNSVTSTDGRPSDRRTIESAIRIGLIFLLMLWCFNIVKPFVLLVLWGAILAVAVYPLFEKLRSALGGREKLAATSMTLIAVALLIVPTVMLSDSAIQNSQILAERMRDGQAHLPAPPASVQEWPLIGESLYGAWHEASTNLTEVLGEYPEQVKSIARWVLSAAAGAGLTILQFIISIIIAGTFLVYAGSGTASVDKISRRLMGGKLGDEFSSMAGATIRSVAQGVLGVAIIQAVLAGIGMMAVGVPYAGIWSLLVLLLAIVQLPTIFVLGPIMVYVFSITGTVPAVVFMIWTLLVGISDSFLKPMLLGRGLETPMLVILLGAIGGMILSGIIGLFVGAVVLAVGYELFLLWLNDETVPKRDVAGDA